MKKIRMFARFLCFLLPVFLFFSVSGVEASGSFVPASISGTSGTVTNASKSVDGNSSTYATIGSSGSITYSISSPCTLKIVSISSSSSSMVHVSYGASTYNYSVLSNPINTRTIDIPSGISQVTISSSSLILYEVQFLYTGDSIPPGDVTNLHISSVNDNTLGIGFDAPTDSDLQGFNLYLNGSLVTNLPKNVTTYSFTGLNPDTDYTIKVVAVDTSGNVSSGRTITGHTSSIDTTPPADVTNLHVSNVNQNSISIEFTAPTDADLNGFRIYLNGSLVASLSKTQLTYTFNGLSPGQTYSMKVVAVDASGNMSAGNTISGATLAPDSTPPSDVTNLHVSNVNQNSISIEFTAPADADLNGFRIYLNGNLVASLPKTQLTYTFNGLSPGQTYSMKVVAVDTSGNMSVGNTISGATLTIDTMPPGDISGIVDTETDSAVSFSFDLPSDPDFSHLEIYRNNILIQSNFTDRVFQDLNLLPATTYTYRFVSVDASGNKSNGVVKTVTTSAVQDNTPPSAPSGLKVDQGNSYLFLSWNKNLEPDLDGYNVYLNGVKYNSSILHDNSLYITDLTNGTVYTLAVTAVDKSGNESSLSSTVLGKPSESGMPLLHMGYDLVDVSHGVSSWFSNAWLILCFSVAIPLAFYIANRIKLLFLS